MVGIVPVVSLFPSRFTTFAAPPNCSAPVIVHF